MKTLPRPELQTVAESNKAFCEYSIRCTFANNIKSALNGEPRKLNYSPISKMYGPGFRV